MVSRLILPGEWWWERYTCVPTIVVDKIYKKETVDVIITAAGRCKFEGIAKNPRRSVETEIDRCVEILCLIEIPSQSL